jgi:hypothetical protein
MKLKLLIGPAALIALSLVPPSASAQMDCSQNTCVQSQTTLVYDSASGTVDAYTTAATDYQTASYYNLCVNIAILQVNQQSPYIRDWPIVLPSTTPSTCSGAVTYTSINGSAPTAPGQQYFGYGLAQLFVVYTYAQGRAATAESTVATVIGTMPKVSATYREATPPRAIGPLSRIAFLSQ